MPLKRCQLGERPGWKWGDRGKCYTYPKGDRAAGATAKLKALRQAAAMGELPGTTRRAG